MTTDGNTPVPVTEFIPPTAEEQAQNEAEVRAIREAAAAEKAARTDEKRQQDFEASLTDDQRERLPRLQARAKRLADAGDMDGVGRIKRMFDSEYTMTATRPGEEMWDYTRVTPWTLKDAVAQIIEPTSNGKPPSLAEQMRRFRDCSERRLNKDGEPFGPPKITDNNVEVWLRSRPWFNNLRYCAYNGGRLIWHNEGMQICLPPWRSGDAASQPFASFEGERALLNRFVTDDDIMQITAELRRAFNAEIAQWNENKTDAFLKQLVGGNAVDPFLEYIKGLEWDGVVRIPEMISNLEHTDYTRAWCEKFVYSMIHRLVNPGAKVDYVFTMVGKSNTRKTSFFLSVTMGILPTPIFTQLPTENKDQLLKTQGGAVVMLDEVDTLIDKGKVRGASAGELKAFITETTDTYRTPYARAEKERPRRYVLAATSNRKDFISDLDGHRRWAVLEVTEQIPEELTPNGDRSYWDMLLAEAYHRYTEEGYRGPSDEEFLRLSEPSRLEHLDDPVYDSITDWLDRPAAERTMLTTSATANGVAAHNGVVNIDCIDIRLLRDAIPDLERRRISGSFKQQVTGAMDRMPGFVRVHLEKNSAGQYKKKRRVVNGKNKPIHTAWDMTATVQAYDAAGNTVGEAIDCLASDVPDMSAFPQPPGGYTTRIDAEGRLVADRHFPADMWPKDFLPAGADYARVDFPYDSPLTSASTLKTIAD